MTRSNQQRPPPVNHPANQERHPSNLIGQAIAVLLISFAVYNLLSLYFPVHNVELSKKGREQLKASSSISVQFENKHLLLYRTTDSADKGGEEAGRKPELVAKFSLLPSGDQLSVQRRSQLNSASADSPELSVTWTGGGSLTVSPLPQFEHSDLTCYRATVAAQQAAAGLCLELPSIGQVYGGGAVFDQRWPINSQSMPGQAYVSNDFAELTGAGRSGLWGGFVERLWLTSRGLLVHVDDATPLSVGQLPDRRLCLTATPSERVYSWRAKPRNYLNATICVAANAKEAYLAAHSWLYTRPATAPDRRMLREPVWCTWARHKTGVTQADVEALASSLSSLGYPASQIEIDDRYTVNYGDLVWDTGKFPNPKKMTDRLKAAGHRVTAWIVPFFNKNTAAYDEASAAGYLVIDNNDNNSSKAADITWWQGVGGMLDPTNPGAVDWFVNRLKQFRQQFGIEAFKFDAGEVYYLRGARTGAGLESPVHFTAAYVEQVAVRFGGAAEVRAGYRTQSVPVATRMFDKDSHWGQRNGLRSIVPNALMLAMAGYHFVMPDMIGGNAYSTDSMEGARPDRELYIRWMQLSCFLPVVQFSIAPWDYDKEVSNIALETLRLRAAVYGPALEAALQELFSSGAPITRPMWWTPDGKVDDQRLWTVDDQFLVGDSLLVAPVTEPGSVARDILVPSGRWKDGYSDRVVTGPQLLKGYPAAIDKVPHFVRI